jgi:hypothetical protein
MCMQTTLGRRKVLAPLVVLAVAAATLLAIALPASAHHPDIVASASCLDGAATISYTATAWEPDAENPGTRANPEITITVDFGSGFVAAGTGAFTAANSYSFSGTIAVPAGATQATVRATATAEWDNGTPGGDFREAVVSLPTDCGGGGGQGCTPGYWKNHTDSWQGYAPSQTVGSTFSAASAYPSIASQTLLEALQGGGGSGTLGAAKVLVRAGTAALLNSAHSGVDGASTTAEVLAAVNAALASGDRDTMLGVASGLDADNNLGCPLN